MGKNKNFILNKDIKKAIYEILLKRIPPKVDSEYLEVVVFILMEALSRGEIEVPLINSAEINNLIYKGWPEVHTKALLESGWTSGKNPPIILKDNMISWTKWNSEMSTLIEGICERADNKDSIQGNKDSKKIKTDSTQLLNHEQQFAINVISESKVILLSGDPGTGKTTTILKMIEKAISIYEDINICLTAPTGKATRKLKDNIIKDINFIDSEIRQKVLDIPCKTIHSLLEARHDGYGKNKNNSISLDILIVDEMSMVDIRLMNALIDAIPIDCKLVLVGDSEQLPPIGSGAVWHKLQSDEIRKRFKQGAIHLKKVYRNKGEIAIQSKLLKEKGLNLFWENLFSLPKDSNIRYHIDSVTIIPDFILRKLNEHLCLLKDLSIKIYDHINVKNIDIEICNEFINLALEKLEHLMILCPKRTGNWGINHIHSSILGRDFEQAFYDWPEGTPVMCGENQPEIGLSNGDIGLIIGKGSERRLLFRDFSGSSELINRLIHPVRLRSIEPAIAMTIHKAQGSEANNVILLWPNELINKRISSEQISTTPDYERKLLYTAITRAKSRVDLVISSKSLAK